MAVTIGYILDALQARMPFERAEEYDNVGLLAGSRAHAVSRALCALDLNPRVLDEAAQLGASLIVTHHPILFRGRKNLAEDDPEGAMLARLVRESRSLIAMHTNFDNADDGVNDALAAVLGLADVAPLEGGVRIGRIPETALSQLAQFVTKRLGGVVRRYGDAEHRVSRVAVLGGSGKDHCQIALDAGADVYITGEIGYHFALEMHELGMCVLEAGHAATEKPAVRHMVGILQSMPGMELEIFESAIEPFL
ncbi:MAG: Nif3-like dinuclear metal center hexameric protein [Christensenellales bacterium]|jgi:dinuclear metal center YbgI/SA1388 family protein